MMKLVAVAMEAHTRTLAERERQRTDMVKVRVSEIRDLVECMFGIPFEEAFDVSKITINESKDDPCIIVDDWIFLEIGDEGGLLVTIYTPCGHRHRVGQREFARGGEDHTEQNLIDLAYMLGRAHLDCEFQKWSA